MNRVEENLRMLDQLSVSMANPDITRNIILMDISRSLSMIADK